MTKLDSVRKICRQSFEESAEALNIFFEIRRQLPEQGTHSFFQRLDAADESVHGISKIVDSFDVRDEPAAFDGENKTFRRFLRPAMNHAQVRQPIKRGVDFDGRKLRGVKLKMFLRFQSAIKIIRPLLVNPAA